MTNLIFVQCCIALASLLLEGIRHTVGLYVVFYCKEHTHVSEFHQQDFTNVESSSNTCCQFGFGVQIFLDGHSRICTKAIMPHTLGLLLFNVMKRSFQDTKHSVFRSYWCSGWTFKNTLL